MFTPQDLCAATPLPCIVIAPDGRIAAGNAGAVDMLGPGFIGRSYVAILRQPDVLSEVEMCLAQGTSGLARFLGRNTAEHTGYRVHIRAVPMGQDHAAVLTFEDVSASEDMDQIRRDFVANVSHELRTPLTAIVGFIDTLQGPAADDAAARERFLHLMASEAGRMDHLINDLLHLSRVEAEQRLRPTQKIDLCDVLETVCHRMQPSAKAAGVDLVWPDLDTPLMVWGEADKLVQVFTNLIENALKYGGAGAGASVTIGVRHQDRDVILRTATCCIDVIDQGPGIDAVHIPLLTQRFYRADTHRSRDMGGTGLGLAIVKHILTRHRGRLQINSELGRGSRFSVILPQLQAKKANCHTAVTKPT